MPPLEEAAAPVAEQAAPAVEQAPAPESGQDAGDDFAGLAARAAAAADGATPGTTTDEPEAKLPEPRQAPRITSARDRWLAKQAAKNEREKLQPVEQQLQTERQQMQAIRGEQQRIEAEAKSAYESGDFDKAFKLRGFGTFEEVQRRFLEKKGAIPPVNPEIEAKLKKVDEWEAREKKRAEEYAQEQQRRQEQHDYDALHDEVKQELTGHRIKGLAKFVDVGGFTDQLAQAIASDPQLTVDQAAADLIVQYREFYKQLDAVKDMLGIEPPAAAPRAAPVALRQADAAEMSGGNPGYRNEDEELAAWAKKYS